jgi:hypothetical protein
LVSRKPVWWALDLKKDINKFPEVVVAENPDPDIETEVIEGISEDEEDEVGLFQRPVSRLEKHVEDQTEIKLTEDEVGPLQRPLSRMEDGVEYRSEADFTGVRGSETDTNTFHDAPEQPEPMPQVHGNTSEAQTSGLDVEIASTETERIELDGGGHEVIGTATEDDHPVAQQVDPVEQPSSRAQQIIERQPALTYEEIDGYDTEEEELRRRSLSRTRRSTHASQY